MATETRSSDSDRPPWVQGGPVLSSVEGFVKIGDFEGPAEDSKHQGWSVLLGLYVSVALTTGSFITSGQQVGSTQVWHVIVAKRCDGATPKTFKHCATGQKIPKVQIHICSEIAGKPQVTTEIELSDVQVARNEIGGAAGLPAEEQMELVGFAFGKIAWTFNKMDSQAASQGKVSESYTVGS